jgi:plasmid stabilization system protein ParE
MRTYVLDPEAQANLANQIDYLNDRGAFDAADRLATRLEAFLANFLCSHPATGRYIPERDLWEVWIPRTRLVLWYRFTDNHLQVVRIWHTAQDRQGAPQEG